MKHLVKAREYYLLDNEGNLCQHIFSNLGGKEKLTQLSHYFSPHDVQEIVAKALPLFEQKLTRSKRMQEFWDHATQEMKDRLLLSYWIHKIEKHRKVINVQLQENWVRQPYFYECFYQVNEKNNWKLFWHWPALLSHFIRKIGKHDLGYRFDNIHLANDKVLNKDLFMIHWDNTSFRLRKFTWLGHIIKDDCLS